tara:strand:- start:537 stop:2792 length:2256 start_codon:yes stop_codon:yes gene_type:complete
MTNRIKEDMASGRPIKKPVKSNLLKARKDANEKALKSGFMKMPGYVKDKFNEEEEFKAHYMYKGDSKIWAKKPEDHERLKKKGYDHDDPKTKGDENKTGPVTTKEAKDYCDCDCECNGKVCKTCGKPKRMVESYLIEKSTPTNPGLWSRAKSAARSKFDVYPSAYANGWAVQWYKKRGGGWRKGKKEAIERAYNNMITELKQSTMKSYIGKAQKQVTDTEKFRDYQNKSMDKMNLSKDDKDFVNKKMDKDTLKRRKGIKTAMSKMNKRVSEEKMTGSEYAGYMKKVKSTNRDVRSAVSHTLDQKKSPLTKAHAKHPEVQAAQKYMKTEQKLVYASLLELSPKTISSYQKKAGAQYRELRKSTPSRAQADAGYYKGYTSDKEYDAINMDREKMKKRGKGLSMSAGKGLKKESYEKGRGPTGIAFAIAKGHPDAENPKTRKKYPERQTPEYKANWAKQSKKSMMNPPQQKEEQQIDELKKSTLGSYVKKATGDAISRSHTSQYNIQKGMSARDKGQEKIAQKHFKKSEKESKKTMDRFHGINRAANKLTPGKDKDEYLADKNKTKMGASEKTFKQMHSGKVKATEETIKELSTDLINKVAKKRNAEVVRTASEYGYTDYRNPNYKKAVKKADRNQRLTFRAGARKIDQFKKSLSKATKEERAHPDYYKLLPTNSELKEGGMKRMASGDGMKTFKKKPKEPTAPKQEVKEDKGLNKLVSHAVNQIQKDMKSPTAPKQEVKVPIKNAEIKNKSTY